MPRCGKASSDMYGEILPELFRSVTPSSKSSAVHVSRPPAWKPEDRRPEENRRGAPLPSAEPSEGKYETWLGMLDPALAIPRAAGTPCLECPPCHSRVARCSIPLEVSHVITGRPSLRPVLVR